MMRLAVNSRFSIFDIPFILLILSILAAWFQNPRAVNLIRDS